MLATFSHVFLLVTAKQPGFYLWESLHLWKLAQTVSKGG